jgi:hypothetical protein
MDALREGSGAADSIKSVSLADLQAQDSRPTFAARAIRLAKIGLMAWGALSLSAVGGVALVYLQGGPDGDLLVSEQDIEAPDKPDESPRVLELVARTTTLPEPASFAEVENADAEEPAPTTVSPEPIVLARLPRPRPDEPIVTGSIDRRDWFERPSPRYDDPCEFLARLGAPLPVRVRCLQESRAAPPRYPPSPPEYRPPQPYVVPWR